MIKPIKVDLPYPNLDNITPNRKDAMIISSAYSGYKGELSAILQYTYHHFWFDLKDIETAEILEGISISEMTHFEILGKTLLKLGIDPVFSVCPPYTYDFYSTYSISYSRTPAKMILDDITSELDTISHYKQMLNNVCDESVSAVISRIILDEELHVRVLKEILEKYSSK